MLSEVFDYLRFDLILFGMGLDGYVASLFPRHPLIHGKAKYIASIKESPKPPPERITFTFHDSGVFHVQIVYAAEWSLVWFLDKVAASKL
ncbi:hypothetical protein L7F22_047508 [Adiantum nelumboides]|nr:hypothetical protein [Adiantum nelumboides]MCO5593494.1 hypothetical protein [Adiantum nelumboides]